MQICTADSEDKKFILDLYLEAFPSEERKPFSLIERKTAMGSMEILVLKERANRIGLAITALEEELVLLDYFAIAPEYRDKGYGTEALLLLEALYSGRQFFLEIEEPGQGAPNQQERIRRKNFYIRNGMRETGIRIQLFGVDMEILATAVELTFKKCEKLYRELLGPLYAEAVKLR